MPENVPACMVDALTVTTEVVRRIPGDLSVSYVDITRGLHPDDVSGSFSPDPDIYVAWITVNAPTGTRLRTYEAAGLPVPGDLKTTVLYRGMRVRIDNVNEWSA